MTQRKLIIVDGNSFIFRAFNALPPLANSKGFPTGCITGVLNMVNSIIKKYKPEKIVIAFDARGKNFRHELYSEYKANRPPMEEELRMQIQPLKEVITAWGLPQLCIEGVEADDSIATMARIGSEQGYEVIISTSDKDMRQSVNKNIKILDTKEISDKKSEPFGIDGVFERSGVYPDRIVDLLALMGDKADNIPGVNGCGEKTALKWLAKYNSCSGVIKNADDVGGVIGDKLRFDIANGNLEMSYNLVVINDTVDLGKPLDKFIGVRDDSKLYELANKYELNMFKKALGLVNKSAVQVSSEIILDSISVFDYLVKLTESDVVQKTIWGTFIYNNQSYVLIKVSGDNKVCVVDIGCNSVLLQKVIKKMISSKQILLSNDSKDILKNLYNNISECIDGNINHFEQIFDIALNDSRIFHYVAKGGKSKTVSIAEINDIYCELKLSDLRVKYKLDDKVSKWEKMSFEELIEVKSEELFIADKFFSVQKELLNLDVSDLKIINLEHKICSILAKMECNGVLIDPIYLENFGNELDKDIEKLKENIYSVAGMEFNINSPQQVAKILFDVLEIESKVRKTSEDILIGLSRDNSIVADILEYRSLSKLKSTYIDGLLSRVSSNNRLHTTYEQTLVLTGRLSSINPNLQNIPIRSEVGRKVRHAFISSNGYRFVAFDYSQIELRILAHQSGEKRLIEAFNNDIDVHKFTASEVFNVDIEEVTVEQRRIGKAINFSLIYGMGYKKLAKKLGITNKESKSYLESYFAKYIDIKPYFEKELKYAQENLFIKTIIDRKLPQRDINTKNKFALSHVELAAKNASIQGSSADIIKMAMIDVFKYLLTLECGSVRMTMQVHDELIFEIRSDLVEKITKEIQGIMQSVISLSVPLLVNYDIADNWLDAH